MHDKYISFVHQMPTTIYTYDPNNHLLVNPINSQIQQISQPDYIDEYGDDPPGTDFRHQQLWEKYEA